MECFQSGYDVSSGVPQGTILGQLLSIVIGNGSALVFRI